MKVCEFAICILAYLRNLWICDSKMSPGICGIAICGLCDLPTSGKKDVITENKISTIWAILHKRICD
jgi:hypothetical protein